jgi:hypothetical protein
VNRPDLMALLGERVTITTPTANTSWTGTLLALGDEPCAVIAQDHGARLCLPQSYTVTRAEEPPPEPRQDDLLNRLDGMLANLQQHINQRAAELAAPHIAEIGLAAGKEVADAQAGQQRAEDLAAELRRQLAVRERYNQSYQGRAAAIRAMHPEHEGRCARCLQPCTCLDDAEQTPDGLWHAWANVCTHGNEDWPCPTIRALDDTPETGRG